MRKFVIFALAALLCSAAALAQPSPIVTLSGGDLDFRAQPANFGLFGPTTGAAARPVFRAITLADLPTSGAYSLSAPLQFLDATGSSAPIVTLQTGTSRGLYVNANNSDITLGSIALVAGAIHWYGTPAELGGHFYATVGGDQLGFYISDDGPTHQQQDFFFVPKRHMLIEPDQDWPPNYGAGSGEADLAFADYYSGSSYERRSFRLATGAPSHAYALLLASGYGSQPGVDYAVPTQMYLTPDFSRLSVGDGRRTLEINAISNGGTAENNAIWVGTSATTTKATTPNFSVDYTGGVTLATNHYYLTDTQWYYNLHALTLVTSADHTAIAPLNAKGLYVTDYNGGTPAEYMDVEAAGITLKSNAYINWSNSTGNLTTSDLGITHPAAGVLKVTDSSTGVGDIVANTLITAGALATAPAINGYIRRGTYEVSWLNSDVTGLSGTTGSIVIATLPAKTVVTNAYVVIGTAAGTVTTLTVSVGRTSAAYIDYIKASNAKAAANTIYGAVVGDRGTNLTGYDLPSWTATTAVYVQFISTGGNLSTVTTSTGTIILETAQL
jgi:hypothetical protein